MSSQDCFYSTGGDVGSLVIGGLVHISGCRRFPCPLDEISGAVDHAWGDGDLPADDDGPGNSNVSPGSCANDRFDLRWFRWTIVVRVPCNFWNSNVAENI